MKKILKRIIVLLVLCPALFISSLFSTNIIEGELKYVQAAELLTLQDLMNKFPEGKYWNHLVKSGHGYDGNYMCYNCGNPDGYSDYPCATHSGNASVGQYDCNGWYGIQCNGFVRKLAQDAYGSMHTSWPLGSIDNVKPGDIIHYKGGGADSTYGHWVMVIAVDGNTLTFGECNWYDYCKITWHRTMNVKESATSYEVYSAPYELIRSTNAPILSNVYISDMSDTGYTVYCDAVDDTGIMKVAFPTWTEANGQDDLDPEWYYTQVTYAPMEGNTYCYKINISDHNYEMGKYITHVYAYDMDGNYVSKEVTTTIQTPTGISLNKTSATLTSKGATTQLTATVSPSNAVDKSVTWKSSNTKVATVSSNGLVTAVGNGEANITATTNSGAKTATCKVTVKIVPTGVSLDKTNATLTALGATTQLTATVSPSNVADKSVTWKSSNTSVATVSSSGLVTAVGNGTATITVTTNAGAKAATCAVTVTITAPEVDGWTYVTALPSNITTANYDIQYQNIYEKYATSSPGSGWTPTGINKTEYVKSGSTYESTLPLTTSNTVRLEDTYYYHFCSGSTGLWVNYAQTDTYTHFDALKSDAVYEHSSSVDGDDSRYISYHIKWSDGNDAYCSTANGTCDGAYGSHSDRSYYWYKMYVYQNYTAQTLNLYRKTGDWSTSKDSSATTTNYRYRLKTATGVSLNKTSATLTSKGATTQLTATVTPSDMTDKSVTWKSSNTSVATVSSSGLVTAVGNGTATITVTTTSGGKTATCKVTVSIAPTSISLDKTDITLTEVGETKQLTATVVPSNAADKTVTWKSSNTGVATVSSSGVVTAVGNGTATITATTAVGAKTANCNVVVDIAVTAVTLSESSVTLSKIGDEIQLSAIVTPNEASNKDVKWESSDESIATVSEDGLITAKGRGTCVITVSATDGSEKLDTCEVVVVSNVHLANSVEELESSHPYEANLNDIWQYTLEGASAMRILFDENTAIEAGADFICVLDKNGVEIGRYTGDELSGKTLVIEGDTVQIQLVSNAENAEYGFAVKDISACEMPTYYNVSFNGNGHTSGSMGMLENCITKEDYELPTNAFEKVGYTFVGWNTNADGSGIAFRDNTTINHPEAEDGSTLVLYAQWKPNTYTIFFDANGGRTEVEEKTVVYDEMYGELPIPTVVGGTFLGWFTDVYEGVQVIADDMVCLTENQTLYAHYELVRIADTPTSSIPSDTEVQSGTKLYLTSDTNGALIYYTTDASIGLDVSAENGTLYDDAIAITEDVTIYAIAVKVGYKDSEVLTVSYTVTDESEDWGDITDADREELGFATTQDIPTELWLAGVTDCDYTGKAITFPDLHVYSYKTLLTLNKDYTVKYANNAKAGTATVTITGKGNYAGAIVKTFAIRPLDLSEATVVDVVVPYNGKVQKSTIKVTYLLGDKTVTLKAGTDFTYIYPGTTKGKEDYDANAFKAAGEYEVILAGKGNYTGTTSFIQTITEKYVIGKMSLTSIASQKYTGEAIEPEIVLKRGKIKLVKDVNYTVEFSDNVEVGTASVTITGIGDYTGTRTATFKITGTALSKVKLSGFKSSFVWTGEEITQDVTFSYTTKVGKETITNYLVEGEDYTVEYQNNKEIGTATVIYKGINGCTGTVKKTYKITGIAMSKVAVKNLTSSMVYDGREMLQEQYELTYTTGKGATAQTDILIEGEDYTVSYKNNAKVGTATISFKGINKYSGTLNKTYKITAYKLTGDKISVSEIPTQTYLKGGVPVKPVVTFTNEEGTIVLVEGKDYTLKYSNHNIVADKTAKKAPTVTITGKGNFGGTVSQKFTIVGSDLSAATMTATNITYQKKANICKPTIAVYDANGKKLAAGTDYNKTIAYTYAKDVEVTQIANKKTVYVTRLQGEAVNKNDIIPVGAEIIATVTGIKNYSGTQSVKFRYVTADIAKATVTVKAQVYTGKAVEPTKNDIVVKIGKTVLEKTDYEIVSYSNNIAKGTGKLVIRGIGNYGGTKNVTFKINTKTMNYTIFYDKNAAGVTGTMKNASISAGKALTANAYKRTGYQFIGWNTRPDGTGVSYNNKEKFYLKDSSRVYGTTVRLYAQWSPIEYKITYKMNGGINAEINPDTYTIETETIVLEAPEREGYTFAGWYTDSKFSSKSKVTEIKLGSTGNKTLYAKWTKNK